MMSGTMGYYSGVHAASIDAIAKHFDSSELASTSAVSFFLLGFAIGPLLFAPLSEMFGRLPIIRVMLFLFVVSNIGCALAPDIQTLLAFRLIGGLTGAPTGKQKSVPYFNVTVLTLNYQSPTLLEPSQICGHLVSDQHR